MKNTLKIKINNLYNTKIDSVKQLHNDIELVNKLIQDKRFTFDEVIDILTSDNQLLECIYDKLAFKRMDDNEDNTYDIVESCIYKFMCNHGKKLTSKHIELFFTCESELKKDDIAWLLLCGGQSYSLITEIANNLGIDDYNEIFCHKVVMTPKQIKLVRNYHKRLLYRDNSRYKCGRKVNGKNIGINVRKSSVY